MNEEWKFGRTISAIIIGLIIGCCSGLLFVTTLNYRESQKTNLTAWIPPTQPATRTPLPVAAPTNTPEPTSTAVSTETELPIEARIIGSWSGAQTNIDGDKIPAIWHFLEGGTMLVEVSAVNMTYGAEWAVEGENRITITTELAPEEPTYRDIEFINADAFKATKEDLVETWSRQSETDIPQPTDTPEPTSQAEPTTIPTDTGQETTITLEEILSTIDGMTDAQRNNYMENLENRRVEQWQGEVTEVDEGEILGGFTVFVNMPASGFFTVISFDVTEEIALSLNKGQIITFSGEIDYVSDLLGTSIKIKNVTLE